jgi:hypothetical protein
MFHPTSGSQPKNSYELVGRRIKELIAALSVKKQKAVVVSRRKDENPEAWHQVMRDIEETNGVSIERLSDGTVRIGWRKYCD